MEKVYHRFELTEIESIKDADRKNYNINNKKILLERLIKKGYEIFEGNEHFNNIPNHIIISGPIGSGI